MGRPKLDKKLNDTFAFRIGSSKKKEFERQIEKIRDELNHMAAPGLYKITSGEVIIAALRKGLRSLTSKDLSKRRARKKLPQKHG